MALWHLSQDQEPRAAVRGSPKVLPPLGCHLDSIILTMVGEKGSVLLANSLFLALLFETEEGKSHLLQFHCVLLEVALLCDGCTSRAHHQTEPTREATVLTRVIEVTEKSAPIATVEFSAVHIYKVVFS